MSRAPRPRHLSVSASLRRPSSSPPPGSSLPGFGPLRLRRQRRRLQARRQWRVKPLSSPSSPFADRIAPPERLRTSAAGGWPPQTGSERGVKRRAPLVLPLRLAGPGDLVDRAVGDRGDEQVAVRSRLDIRRDAEVPADQQALALREVVLRVVVGDPVLQAWIVDGDLLAVARQVEPEQVSAGRQRGRRPDEQVALELRAEAPSLDESDRRGRDGPLP